MVTTLWRLLWIIFFLIVVSWSSYAQPWLLWTAILNRLAPMSLFLLMFVWLLVWGLLVASSWMMLKLWYWNNLAIMENNNKIFLSRWNKKIMQFSLTGQCCCYKFYCWMEVVNREMVTCPGKCSKLSTIMFLYLQFTSCSLGG